MLSQYRYQSIDMLETGWRLVLLFRQKGYSVKDIQKLMQLSCPQPVYRWIKGQTLPSVDHIYNLAGILDVPMEEILVPVSGMDRIIAYERGYSQRERMHVYYRFWREKAA